MSYSSRFLGLLRRLGSTRLTTGLIVLLFLEVLWGTILETREGMWEAHRLVFGNWWGGVPWVCFVAALNLVASLAFRFRWRWSSFGLGVAHLGFVALLVSGGLGMAFSRTSQIDLGPGETTSASGYAGRGEGSKELQVVGEVLPFRITLKEFRRELHPGSSRAKSFESHLVVREGKIERDAVIRMNHPLRLHGFTLYQSSWRTDKAKGVERSILSVVRNPSGSWPYWSTLLICIGLSLHFLPRFRIGRHAAALILLAATTVSAGTSTPAVALPNAPPSLCALPMQIDGRVKSFETFAAHTLLQLSGRSTAAGMDASRWLAAVLLEPGLVADLPVFLVENPDVRDALALTGKDRDRYSWSRLHTAEQVLSELASMAASKPPEQRTALDREVLRLSDAMFRYEGITLALALLRTESVAPIPGRIPPAASFLQIALESEHHAAKIDSLAGLDSVSRTPEQSEILTWYRSTFEGNAKWEAAEFPVLPIRGQGETHWGTPSIRVLKEGLGDSTLRRTMQEWDALRSSWLAGKDAASEAAAKALRDSVIARGGPSIRLAALDAESWYNKLSPFYWSMLLFAFAFLPAVFGLWRGKIAWIRVGDALSGMAMILLLGGMGLRMIVTQRPPVTNLYETFLFVAAIVVPALIVPAMWRGWKAGSALGALTGFVLLLLSRGFGVDGDTMPVLVAVLDSNFWLAVHVLTITVGYGGVIAAGIAAHWFLWQLKRGQAGGFEIVLSLAGFGLFFTFIGTLLGGVWADQSWGRFWGWDPKENGALLIVLWIAGTFHARLSGMIGQRGFAAWTAGSISTVLFAWFGVNLLGVGLHSYGFIEGTFKGVAAWGVAEGLFLAWALWPKARSEGVPPEAKA